LEPEIQEHRRKLIEAEFSLGIGYVKTLTWLSAGALSLSIAFLKDIARPSSDCGAALLKGSWACFSLSLVIALLSYKIGELSYRRAREALDNESQDQEGGVAGGLATKWLAACNWTAGILFVVGIAAMLSYMLLSWS
jgi:hypothetical protein